MSRISVVIPAYRASETLQDTIRSIVVQTYPPFEVIVVLDGPDDECVRLFRNANFPAYVKLIELPHNVGVASARNNGIKISRGDYIALCDADDVWHPQKLEVQFNYARKGYTLIGSQAHRFKNSKELAFKKTNPSCCKSFQKVRRNHLRAFNPFYTSSLMFDRKLISEVQFDATCQQEDYQFLIDVFNSNNLLAAIDKRKLIGYRVVANSRSGGVFYSAINNFILRRKNYGLNIAVLLSPLYLLNVIRKRYLI